MGLAPESIDALAEAVREAGRSGRALRPEGGGTRSRRGAVGPAAEPVATTNLTTIVDHTPAELTITVEAGMPAERLAETLAGAGQWWPQADIRPASTIGGILATGASGRGRLRHGPVRDSLLEVVLVTGDGRVVTGGGRTVKGVAGYDIPRLAVGSHGSLGVIAQVTLKLWPRPPARGWFAREGTLSERLAAAQDVLRERWKPASLLLTPDRLTIDLQGPAADVTAPVGFTDADEPPDPTGTATLDIGVPPRALERALAVIEEHGFDYVAEVGVGAIRVAVATADDVRTMRALARDAGGHAVICDAPDALRADGWGDPPAGAAIMARLKRAFDPTGVLPPIPATRPAT